MSASRRNIWTTLVDRSLRVQVRIFLVIFVVTGALLTWRVVDNHVNPLWAVLGVGIGIAIGWALVRGKPLAWDRTKRRVVTSNTLFGLIVLLLYLIFVFTKNRILGEWIDSARIVGVTGLGITCGVMLGRIWLTFRGIRGVLKTADLTQSDHHPGEP